MDRRSNSNSFNKAISSNPFITDQQSEETDNVSSLTGPESPPSSSLASPRKGTKRSMQKRVVSVPIKDAEGSRLKGESAPPSDSWAWRKYGQKPIKGSPYPRGYYRCSSSKGCPARKQVERSRLDPAMLVITYSCEHNHPWPAASRKQMEATETTKKSKKVKQDSILLTEDSMEPESGMEDGFAAGLTTEDSMEPESGMEDGFAAGLTTGDSMEPESGMEDRFAAGLTTQDSILTTADEFGWFGEMETISSTVLESPLFLDNDEADTAVIYPMREEDESLFADLGELPECSFVFRHQRNVGPQVGIC